MYRTLVYLDDWIGAAVENASGTLLGWIAKETLRVIHIIPTPPLPKKTGLIGGKYPIFLKKLQKVDSCWDSEKGIMGFLVDGGAKTVQITDNRDMDIVIDICKIIKEKHVQIKRYHHIVGKMCHNAIILPGTKGLF